MRPLRPPSYAAIRSIMSDGIGIAANDRDFWSAALAWTRSTTNESRSTAPTVVTPLMRNVPTLNGSTLFAAVPVCATAASGSTRILTNRATITRAIEPP
jgi:hypothetical protein